MIDREVQKIQRRLDVLEAREGPLAAEFLQTASSASDDLTVIVPGYDDGEHAFGPVKWSPIGGALPQTGDEAVIMERDDGVWQVVAWWNDSQGTGVAQSAVDDLQDAIDALDARVDTLEAIRTGGARITAGNPPTITSQTGDVASVARQGAGITRVTFTFNGAVYVGATIEDNSAATPSVSVIGSSPAIVDVYTWNAAGSALDRSFHMTWRA